MKNPTYLKEAVQLAVDNVENKGGPFGAIITDKNGTIIGEGTNIVTKSNDPTAHAEIQAIRQACQAKQTFQLSDCILYTSCEPCPMCLGAIYWSRIEKVYYAADQKQAAAVGFDDAFIYEEIEKAPHERQIPFQEISLEERNQPFEEWNNKPDKIKY
ncbi:tRNA-specific adenosine deaminase [Sediminibacillus dalangtanensis]|uniref:tRNA-specific adenosine deaminase n=1 Tax=Sediminibacillus dalangtanensis TaxID=2729421 RepID=A0ABX7VUC4_9BACI|nr:nucleoside deaminase [Sediminibacillus dalangtanensis]QTN00485.1 tRNA-specific adenosine deaminase [Sediminibacillus dalangtanensis]